MYTSPRLNALHTTVRYALGRWPSHEDLVMFYRAMLG